MTTSRLAVFLIALCLIASCKDKEEKMTDDNNVKLMVLDPGHFHAALVQKTNYPQIDTNVYVYAPAGAELQSYLNLVKQYKDRNENPAHWHEELYTGTDFFSKMLAEKKGNLVVLSGNNRLKTEYISESIGAGLDVLADKPMAIDTIGFTKVEAAFKVAAEKNVLLYDIMTERSEITNILQKELMHMPALFGELKQGTEKDPAVLIESIHYFSKMVSGKQLIRPAWFFDPLQQGNSITDVGTHLVDIVQWQCFPEANFDYKKDISINNAKKWPTPLTLSQFSTVTGENAFPDYLKPLVVKDSILNTAANGEMNYSLRGVHVKIIARWDYKAAEGGDAHHAIINGSKAILEIRQEKATNYKPVLYIKAAAGVSAAAMDSSINDAIAVIGKTYPGVTTEKQNNEWKVVVPASYDIGHEAHFGQVMQRFLDYKKAGSLPKWELAGMLAKYYTTTMASAKAE